MGRFKVASVISLALLIVIEACHSSSPQPLTTVAWNQKGDGVWEAYTPNYSTPSAGQTPYPEFAVLRMRDDIYQKFRTACTAGQGALFLNQYHIFANNINVVLSPCPQTNAAAPPPGGTTYYWYVVVPHWPNSTATASSYPEWNWP